MIVNEVNPSWLTIDRYVEFLNRGFSGHWDRRSFEWYLRRFFDGRPADINVRAEGTRVLSGIMCCYRKMQYGSDDPVDVSILSAVTTLPEEQGRGHYRALLETSIEVCRRNSCAAVLGFVTRENASGRGLLRLGARAIPTFYIVSKRSTGTRQRTEHRRPTIVDASKLKHLPREPERRVQVRFHYSQPRDWHWQFIRRSRPVIAMRMAHDSLALVEKVGRTDRLQWLGCPAEKTIGHIATLASVSAQAGRDFFMYTVDPRLAHAATRQGLQIRRGLLVMLPLDRRGASLQNIPDSAWHVQSGDRL